mmetsp:Transcript_38444/g.66798  ORF Transcript_38444/g.66798 Transcript_38444/m.66798 type:complete len:82 (+) Transcript_38444:83-328(+)
MLKHSAARPLPDLKQQSRVRQAGWMSILNPSGHFVSSSEPQYLLLPPTSNQHVVAAGTGHALMLIGYVGNYIAQSFTRLFP